MSQKNRPLFVFAGQSNMMGAAVFQPTDMFSFIDSYEYLHKPRRMGEKKGEFKREAFPTGEFSYWNLDAAYPEKKDFYSLSHLSGFTPNTYFCPAISNLLESKEKLTEKFGAFSEADFRPSPCLPPYLVRNWERLGHNCAYTHIAKGAVSIEYFLDSEMLARFDREAKKLEAPSVHPTRSPLAGRAGEYFEEKVRDFFTDCETNFQGDDMSVRALFWLQGESDAGRSCEEYKLALQLLWEQALRMGFTHFFCIRVGFWDSIAITEIMRAQEQFCRETDNACMLTRIGSYFPLPSNNPENWFEDKTVQKYQGCRDSFCGFDNNHYNQKGFELIAEACVRNLDRLLNKSLPPILEPEMILPMKDDS